MTAKKFNNEKIICYSHSENLNGKSIQVSVTNYDQVLEITIKRPTNLNVYKKCIVLFLITIITIILYLFGIINIFHCWIPVLATSIPFYNILFSVKQEKVLIMKSLGYQIESYYFLGHTSSYIPWEHIKTIFINEVVSKQRVIFLLTLLTKDTNKVIPLFTETIPRLQCLEMIYQCIEPCHN